MFEKFELNGFYYSPEVHEDDDCTKIIHGIRYNGANVPLNDYKELRPSPYVAMTKELFNRIVVEILEPGLFNF